MDLFVLFDFCSFGLWFVFWVLISLCALWVISHGYGLVMSSLFFGLISHGYGLFWFLCSLVDSHGSGLVLISHGSGFWFLSYLSLGFEFLWSLCSHLSAIILHDQSRFNISYLSSFKDIFCQWDPKYYVYLLMPYTVSLAALPVNWLKNFEGFVNTIFFFFFFFSMYLLLQKEVQFFCFALYL